MKIKIILILCFGVISYAQNSKITLNRVEISVEYSEKIKKNRFFFKVDNDIILSEFYNIPDTLGLAGGSALAYYIKEEEYKENILSSCDCPSFGIDGSILVFEDEKVAEKVVIWRLNGELASKFYFFVIDQERNFHKLGEIYLGVVSDFGDAFNIPDEIVVVSRTHIGFEILFNGKTFFSDKMLIQSNKGGRLISNDLILSYYW